MLFSVYVRPEDFPIAKNIDEKVFAAEVPDSQGMPHLEDLDFSSCPGCGNRLGENDLKCSSCGLDRSSPGKVFSKLNYLIEIPLKGERVDFKSVPM